MLKIELAGIAAQRAKHSRRLQVVLTTEEVGRLMKAVKGEAGMVCRLLYGCGLRVAEALALRVKDVDVGGGKLEVRGRSRGDWREPRQTEAEPQPRSDSEGVRAPGGGARINGDKDRVVSLPKSLLPGLKEHLERIRQIFEADRREEQPGVALPGALEERQPHAGETWPWFWLFPAAGLSMDPRSGIRRRHHLHEIGISRELGRAAGMAQLGKRVTAHALRHSFATHLLLRGVDICRCGAAAPRALRAA